MENLIIDPEFRDKIRPLTEAEYEQLRENILSDGEVYEPIVTWHGTIIDGHNRWRIIQEHPEIPYRVKEMDFADKWEAVEWMYRKQLGRRNLTDEQRKYMIGQMYEARKKTQGGNHGTSVDPETGRFTANGQNVHLRGKREIRDGTAGQVGKEVGVNERTVRRAADFAKGVDALKEVSPAAAEKVLSGSSGVTQSFIAGLPNMEAEQVKKAADYIVSGSAKKKNSGDEKSEYAKARQLSAEIRKINAEMASGKRHEYTEKDLIAELRVLRDEFIGKVKQTLKVRADVIGNGEKVLDILVSCERKIIEIEDQIGGKVK